MSFFVVGCILAFFALAGLTFDGGGKIREAARADAVAREAARAACEQINQVTVLSKGTYVLDRRHAQRAGSVYANAQHMQGFHLIFPRPDTCLVTLTATYRTQLLGLLGVDTLKVSGTGQAQFVYGVTGIEG
ncbi:hypothetical protein ABH931_007579 [Streptacidiphilus sp. MAP12-33]|uniref:hypothetical protein n=1 Tax=Streptacidiphilus sp. MAP12-33 TaxID=3156266 RepID=UPI003517B92A